MTGYHGNNVDRQVSTIHNKTWTSIPKINGTSTDEQWKYKESMLPNTDYHIQVYISMQYLNKDEIVSQ